MRSKAHGNNIETQQLDAAGFAPVSPDFGRENGDDPPNKGLVVEVVLFASESVLAPPKRLLVGALVDPPLNSPPLAPVEGAGVEVFETPPKRPLVAEEAFAPPNRLPPEPRAGVDAFGGLPNRPPPDDGAAFVAPPIDEDVADEDGLSDPNKPPEAWPEPPLPKMLAPLVLEPMLNLARRLSE